MLRGNEIVKEEKDRLLFVKVIRLGYVIYYCYSLLSFTLCISADCVTELFKHVSPHKSLLTASYCIF